jgi:hypothetical protein
MRIIRLVATLGVAAGLLATPSTGIVNRPSIDPGHSSSLRSTGPLANFEARGNNLIRLLAGAFDPASGSLPRGAGLALRDRTTLPQNVAQYWLVQVRDGRYGEVFAAADKAGATVVGAVPDNAYMVRATPAQRNELARSAAVRWAGYYQPAWRIPIAAGDRASLMELSGKQRYRVHVFADDPSRGSVTRALRAMSGVTVLRDAGVVVDVEATRAELPAIAAIPAVEWIGQPPTFVRHNFNARWVNDTGVRDLYAATLPGRLNGAGQVAAVADTGINYKLDLNGRAHINFRDCDAAGVCKEAIYTQVTPGTSPASRIDQVQNNGTGHRKMVAYFDLGQAGPNMYDESSHGTHVAGSVTGDKAPFGSWQGADGIAPAAGLVHQNTADTGGGLAGIPADEYDMLRQAYRPRNPGSVLESSPATGSADYGQYIATEDARTHNNSWGAIFNVVDDGTAHRYDRFVWDHEDMAIVASAGNDGPGTHTISVPALAKNDFTSGASANGRQPMVSIDSMAIFSSHGPTGDGRYGVDFATPGQIVVSAKGGTVDDEHTAQGTSMSGPILTGLATLVRQYFWDGYGPANGKGFAGGAPVPGRRHNPSAALVKAAFANGAVRMRGWYTGDDGQARPLDGQWPSMGQGFGLINLDNSLYFSNDPTNNWYHDVWRGDAESFAAGTGATRTYTVNVQAGAPLDVTLAWTDAPTLIPAGTPALMNDLNLTVTGPGGTFVGNNMNTRAVPSAAVAETLAAPGPADASNTIERVRVNAPITGTYTITVTGANVLQGRQGYALAASGRIGNGFTPGPARQRDLPGSPTISNVAVEPISSSTAIVRFTTNEPTTATATAGGETYVDSYNAASTGFPGLNEGTVETSADYSNKPVVGTSHEILMTALAPGQSYSIALEATDLASNTANQSVSHRSPALAYQADAPDIGYFSSGPNGAAQWRTGTQMYAGTSFVDPLNTVAQRHLGAWMFRVPEAAVDPNTITGAVVETTARHNWVVQYTADPQFSVDLLNESVEPNWGSVTQNYDTIRTAPAAARVFPETGYERGGGKKYAFTFNCSQLAALKTSLASVAGGERKAAFRYQATPLTDTSLFSMDFGFNRRSSGPAFRPRLLLFTGNTYPTGEGCDASAPAPVIEEVGIQNGLTAGSVTVTWKTDNVSSDSMVLFRERGSTTGWTQVGTLARTKVHQVQVQGLDDSKFYEFVVRSRACNGQTTTDANGGAGYDFYRHAPDPGPRTQHGSTFDFETGDEGWTVSSSSSDQTGLASEWRRGPTGAGGSATGWHVTSTTFGVPSYHNFNETTLTSPGPVAFGGQLAAVEFEMNIDTEATFDFLHVEYSPDGATWTEAGRFDGISGGYVPTEVRFLNPGVPTHVRFRFKSDELISSPAHFGVSIDRVTYASYPNAPPSATESLPLTGPVPPPSAGATGLTAPPTRTGAASAADVAAGTGACVVPGAAPDLRVTNIVASDRRGREGRDVTFTATIRNVGDASAIGSQTQFRIDGTTIATLSTPSLGPNQSANVSTTWDTKHQAGDHVLVVTADALGVVQESNEGNNDGTFNFHVSGNRIENGSFEESSSGSSPDAWTGSNTGAGSATWTSGGSDGTHSVSLTGNGGSALVHGSPTWTSAPVPVAPGETLELVTDVRASGLTSAPSAGLVYLGALGEVVGTAKLLTAPLQTAGFTTLEQTVTIPAGVAQVRVVLTGFAVTDVSTAGTVTFDAVGLFAQ